MTCFQVECSATDNQDNRFRSALNENILGSGPHMAEIQFLKLSNRSLEKKYMITIKHSVKIRVNLMIIKLFNFIL